MLLALAFDVTLVAPVAAFAAIFAVTWFVWDWLSGGDSRAEQRLDDFRNPGHRRKREEEAAKGDSVAKVLERTSALAKPLQPKSEAEAGKLKQRLVQAGFRGEQDQAIFLGLKFLGLLLGAFLAGGTMLLVQGASQQTLVRTIGLAGLMFYLPDIILFFISKSRRDAIFLGLPDALDLMVVCVEAGLALDQAMRKVTEEMKKSHPIISQEFGLCNLQLQMGRTRAQVLQELGQRSGVEDLRALASILIQADKFGSSIAQALRVQSDAMRTRRRQIAEEKAAKTAVKLIFPLVIFIFPGIFVVLVGPAAITMVRQMFPMMSGQ